MATQEDSAAVGTFQIGVVYGARIVEILDGDIGAVYWTY